MWQLNARLWALQSSTSCDCIVSLIFPETITSFKTVPKQCLCAEVFLRDCIYTVPIASMRLNVCEASESDRIRSTGNAISVCLSVWFSRRFQWECPLRLSLMATLSSWRVQRASCGLRAFSACVWHEHSAEWGSKTRCLIITIDRRQNDYAIPV